MLTYNLSAKLSEIRMPCLWLNLTEERSRLYKTNIYEGFIGRHWVQLRLEYKAYYSISMHVVILLKNGGWGGWGGGVT